MKLLRTIGTLAIGATAGFVACGALTVKGVLKSERHRKALSHLVAERLSEELFTERSTTSKVTYRAYQGNERKRPEVKRGPIDIVFETGVEAETAFDHIKQLMKEYGQVTVADVCDICELDSNYADNKSGWTHVSDMYIDNSDRCMLHLPKPLPLK